jgi:hypothetical protein
MDTKIEKGLEAISKASFVKKTEQTLPEGAKVLSKETSIKVEEIQNGYLLCKSTEIKYQLPKKDYHDYMYLEEKWFSKENPINIKIKEEKALSDII